MKIRKHMPWRSHGSKTCGFTIVELLIVIAVIAILALITITTYSKVQQRAANAKTIAAVEVWVKALRLYEADKGVWPDIYPACLGSGYPTGNPTGSGQCYKNSSFTEKAAFNSEMEPYIGKALPTPDLTAIGSVTDNWRRGAYYQQNSGAGGIYVSFVIKGNGACPNIGGASLTNSNSLGSGRYCQAQLEAP